MQQFDVIIIGAGAAGLFCAAQLGKAGKKVAVLDNGKKIGRKILMSGGGFCNFTNLNLSHKNYICQNPHFVKSALARYNQWDFINLVNQYQIAYHEKEEGQLFTDEGSEKILLLLKSECQKGQVQIFLKQEVISIEKHQDFFQIKAAHQDYQCTQVVIATGGLSMPALGATAFGYKVAQQFNIPVIAPRASLVPFTYRSTEKYLDQLAGIALSITASCRQQSFTNQMLFTHRGISGPAILQISNYWQTGDCIQIDLLPHADINHILQAQRQSSAKLQLKTLLSHHLPRKLVELFVNQQWLPDKVVAQLNKADFVQLNNIIHQWQFIPNGTEGYRTAEVTIGGVDCDYISSKTMESKSISNLYFIGEVLDVTGWLGGYNFQWAWSSAFACAEGILAKY